MKELYQKIILANGLRIISSSMASRQSLALGIWINIGGRFESFKNKGISHLLEHLLFKGTSKYNYRQLKESIEGLGGSLNGFTSEELTCYLVKIPAVYWEVALEVLSDMVINPALPQEQLEKEKPVILEEIKMYQDMPQSYVYDLLDELLWPGQLLGAPVIGRADSVKGITREELCAFKERHYTPANIVISACGCLDYKKLAEKAAGLFASRGKQKKNTFLRAKEEQTKPLLKIFHKKTEQTHMALGFHSLARGHSLKHALSILHIVLGANMSSRLFNEVREKRGLAYEIGTQLKRFHDTGAFIVHAGIDNRKAKEAIALILKELAKIKQGLITEDEFVRAKKFYLGQIMLALEDTLDHMLWIGESTATLDKTYSLEDIINEVERLRPEQIQQAAAYLFKDDNLNLALIGPLKDKEQDIYRQLKIKT